MQAAKNTKKQNNKQKQKKQIEKQEKKKEESVILAGRVVTEHAHIQDITQSQNRLSQILHTMTSRHTRRERASCSRELVPAIGQCGQFQLKILIIKENQCLALNAESGCV
jgi:hypothetical protein